MVFCARAHWIILEDCLAIRGRFFQSNIHANDSFEEQFIELRSQGLQNLFGNILPSVIPISDQSQDGHVTAKLFLTDSDCVKE